jgi:hypothetical protein
MRKAIALEVGSNVARNPNMQNPPTSRQTIAKIHFMTHSILGRQTKRTSIAPPNELGNVHQQLNGLRDHYVILPRETGKTTP